MNSPCRIQRRGARSATCSNSSCISARCPKGRGCRAPVGSRALAFCNSRNRSTTYPSLATECAEPRCEGRRFVGGLQEHASHGYPEHTLLFDGSCPVGPARTSATFNFNLPKALRGSGPRERRGGHTSAQPTRRFPRSSGQL